MSLIDKNSHVLMAPLEKSFFPYGEEALNRSIVTTDFLPETRLSCGDWGPMHQLDFSWLVVMVELCFYVQTD